MKIIFGLCLTFSLAGSAAPPIHEAGTGRVRVSAEAAQVLKTFHSDLEKYGEDSVDAGPIKAKLTPILGQAPDKIAILSDFTKGNPSAFFSKTVIAGTRNKSHLYLIQENGGIQTINRDVETPLVIAELNGKPFVVTKANGKYYAYINLKPVPITDVLRTKGSNDMIRFIDPTDKKDHMVYLPSQEIKEGDLKGKTIYFAIDGGSKGTQLPMAGGWW
jgi:hypothetical protein